MTRNTDKFASRSRSDVGRGGPGLPADSVPPIGTAALATAAGAVAIAALDAQTAKAAVSEHSAPVPPLSEEPRDHDGTQPEPTQSVGRTDDSAAPAIGSDAGAIIAAADQAAYMQQPQTASAAHDVPAIVSDPSSQVIEEASHVSDQILGDSAIVARIAEQITSSVGTVLEAAQNGNVDGLQQTLAKDILHTATGILDEIRSEIHAPDLVQSIEPSVGMVAGPIAEALPDVGHQLDRAAADIPVLDLLNGASILEIASSPAVDGVVTTLSGTGSAETAVAAEATSQVIAIPASVLGGADHGKGALADIFYDDGGSEAPSHVVSDLVSAAEPVDLGFLGQPLVDTDQPAGMFHGSSALHLV